MKSLRIITLLAFVMLAFAISASAQLMGTKNIPGDYADLAAAITDLNTQGVGAGGVTFNLIAGNPQTAPAGGYIIGGTGSAVLTTASMTNPIVFTGNGNTITASAALTVGALNDGIFKLIGADWTTIGGFMMLENPANIVTVAGTNTMTEWGVALLYVTATDGANSNTITGNTIDLNRTYQNTFGIYANATHTATAVTTSATATGTAGGNSGLMITANNITDVNNGIVVVGPTAAADHNNGVTIGGTAPNANTITNYGTTGTFSGYANVSGTVNGILVRNSINATVSFNSVTSSVGGVTAGTLNGIQFPAFSATPAGTFTQNVNNNTVSLQSGLAAGAMVGITYPSGSASATSTLNINNNNFSTFGHTVAASGTITFISTASTNQFTNINSNTFTNITVNTTGSVTFISHGYSIPTNGSLIINGNSIVTAFNKTGAGGTVTLTTSNSLSGTGSVNNYINNNFSNITVTGATGITGFNNTDGGTGSTKTITGNTFNSWTGGTSAINTMNFTYWNGVSSLSNNTITNITGQGAVTGVTMGATSNAATSIAVSNNIINNLTSTGTGGAVTGLTCSNTSAGIVISGNTINTLSSTGASAVNGISIPGASNTTVSRNKIYDLAGSNASSTVNGVSISSGTTVSASNNLIGDLRTPAANAANPLTGINVSGGTTVNIDFNTVYLNATSTGALFGSAAINASTTPTLTLRSNIFVNLSTPTGAGETVAYRRSSITLTTYGAASNGNLFYAGTPSATNLLFTDLTTDHSTLAGYKALVSPRDSTSVTENPPFLSTSGASAMFLHINPAIATQIESGGVTVAGITVDFDGDTRSGTPDIGADEGAFTILDIIGPAISYTPFANSALLTNRNLTVTITDASGVAGGGLAPRIYFRKNAGAYVSTQCTGSSPTYTCTIDYSMVGGVVVADVIDYFVIAQDTIGNVSINPSAGAAATDVNTVTTPPTTPNTYTIIAPFPSTVNVPGDYPSLTNAGGLFEAMNAGSFTGNTVVNITADLAGELGTHALNQLNEEGAGAGTYTVLIKPSGAPRIISGTSALAIIRLNGADRVRIDGSTAATLFENVVGGNPALRELTIENTNVGTSSGVILVGTGTNGAQNNILRNLNVDGNAPTTTLVAISLGGNTVGTAGADNDNNRVENCRVRRAIFGIYSAGASLANQNTGTVIQENQLDATGTDRLGRVGIILFNDNGAQIVENSVGGIASSVSADSIGIGLGVGAADAQFSNTAVTGGGITNALVTRNRINGVSVDSTWGAAGIAVAGDTGGANTISNNMITGVISDATSPDLVAGIFVAGVTGSTTRVYHNSISMTGDRSALATPGTAQQPSYGIAITGADPTIELKNNIFYTTQFAEIVANPNARSYAIGMVTATFVNLDSNYNDFWSTGVQDGGFRSGSLASAAGTSHVDLTAWQTATGGGATDDFNSQESDPVYINPLNDLHLNAATTPLLGDGITGFATVDYDNDPRPASMPEIGADEIVQAVGGVIPAGTFYNASGTLGDSLAGNVTVTNNFHLTGIVDAGANTLTLGCNASVTGGGATTYVIGNFAKQFCAPGSFTFEVGTTPNGSLSENLVGEEYSPFFANVTTVATVPSTLTVNVVDNFFENGMSATQSASRHWNVTETGDLTADISFTYLDVSPGYDVNGTETSYQVLRRAAGITTVYPGGTVNDATNTATAPGVMNFSQWGAGNLAPLAASVNVGGRVFRADGQPISRARVLLTDSNGTSRLVQTNAFGYYNFEGVESGQTVVVSVAHKQYIFAQPSRVIDLGVSVTDADFVATGENDLLNSGDTYFDKAPFDFDGDSRTDMSVFRADKATWLINQSSDGRNAKQAFGLPTDALAPADFDGDGRTDYAVFRAAEGTWYIWNSAANDLRVVRHGNPGDVPVPSDVDGDLKADLILWNASRGTWSVLQSTDGKTVEIAVENTDKSSVPMLADYDTDGRADLTIYVKSSGTWRIVLSSTGETVTVKFGTGGSGVMGDFTGDSRADLAVYADGVWTIRNSRTGEISTIESGAGTALLGDFDGDNRLDVSVYQTGRWTLRQSASGMTKVRDFGADGDLAIPSIYVK